MNKPAFRVTLLLFLVLSITTWNILRWWTGFAWRATLTEFAGAETATVTMISGAAWSVLGIFAAWALLAQKRWAPATLAWLGVAYSLWYWAARLLWQSVRPNWVFAAIINVTLIAFVLFVTSSLSREAYERKIENPKTE